MMSVVASAASTRLQMLGYTALMSVAVMLPWGLGLVTAIYGITALVTTAIFVALNVWVVVDAAPTPNEMRAERALFLYSIAYMLIIFGAFAVDRMLST